MDMRNMIINSITEKAIFGKVEQGMIFSCAIAEDYEKCNVHGIIITARCDIAQYKARNYNYLPVVTFGDWIHRDFRLLLADQIRKDINTSVSNLLKKAGHSPAVIETLSINQIYETLFMEITDKKLLKDKETFASYVRDLELLDKVIKSEPQENVISMLADKYNKIRDKITSELVKQHLNGYYFFDSIDQDNDLGYVVLLREIRHISRDLIQMIANGLESKTYDELCDRRYDWKGRLVFNLEIDMAMPVSKLRSPNLEHLLQSFSMLFGRIGLTDVQEEYISSLWSRQIAAKGE